MYSFDKLHKQISNNIYKIIFFNLKNAVGSLLSNKAFLLNLSVNHDTVT